MNSPAMQGSISSRPQLWEIFNSLTIWMTSSDETGKKDSVGVGVRNEFMEGFGWSDDLLRQVLSKIGEMFVEFFIY